MQPNLPQEIERINKTTHDVQQTTEIVQGQRIKVLYFLVIMENQLTWVQMSRIDGTLAVSRALGDGDFKNDYEKSAEEQAVSAVPDIIEVCS